LKPWLKEPTTLSALNGNAAESHPLAADIFQQLVGLVPRRLHHQQLWELLDDPVRTVALRMAAALEATYLDTGTVTCIAELIRQAKRGSEKLFRRLFNTRSSPQHPLNAEFLDSVLRAMPVSERDLHWTEWIRKNHALISDDLTYLEQRWRNNLTKRTVADALRAKWIMWLLTTTVLNLRDRATRALYWFGRGAPGTLFEQTEKAVNINDPYIFERILGASYGVAMALHCAPGMADFTKTILPEHARRIFDLMFEKNAPGRTTHELTREYGRRFIELARLHNKKLLSAAEFARVRPPYSDSSRIDWREIEAGEEGISGADSPSAWTSGTTLWADSRKAVATIILSTLVIAKFAHRCCGELTSWDGPVRNSRTLTRASRRSGIIMGAL
jgi:hypothetical protein